MKNKPPTTGISPVDYAGNFSAFLKQRPAGKPFYFWYGGHEPHRAYENGSGLRAGKKLSDVTVPSYLPDTEIVRSDLLDYALEIEWFDTHLGRMLKTLEEMGELDNTLVVVTADNGMPFPRVKGHIFEDACHLPLAVRWGNVIKKGRVVDDFVSFIDYAPTFLTAAGLDPLKEMTGKSLMGIFKSDASGQVEASRDHVIVGRERTDIGRPNDEGYPVRGVRTKDFFYTHNFKPDRWPCGNPETGYKDTDDSPTKKLVIQMKDQRESKWWDLAMGKRGADELYNLSSDPGAVVNLVEKPEFAAVKERLWGILEAELKGQDDPRILGKGDIFDTYKYLGNHNGGWDEVMKRKQQQEKKQ